MLQWALGGLQIRRTESGDTTLQRKAFSVTNLSKGTEGNLFSQSNCNMLYVKITHTSQPKNESMLLVAFAKLPLAC